MMEIKTPKETLERSCSSAIYFGKILFAGKKIYILPSQLKIFHVDVMRWNLNKGCDGRSFTGKLLQFSCKYIQRLKSSKPKMKFQFTCTHILLNNYFLVRPILSLLNIALARELQTTLWLAFFLPYKTKAWVLYILLVL